MNTRSSLRVKIADEPWEFAQIHQLNHQTFAEEIPQHPTTPSGYLIDKFHDENTYVIGLRGRRLAGMMAIRGRRPFSLDQKLANLDDYLPERRSICELRLLAVDRRDRAGRLLPALLDSVWRHVLQQGYDVAVISGTTRQLRLYRHIGFVPFGPLVGPPAARFQPMMLTLERFAARAPKLLRGAAPVRRSSVANFLPGPVAVRQDVRDALDRPAESHRSAAFAAELQSTKTCLCQLVGARRVEILLGSGTAANDAVAGQLSLERGSGIVLSNGEFGERLVDHARRFRLHFDAVTAPWGHAFDLDAVGRRVSGPSAPAWLWFVHCETSTGTLNDLDGLGRVCSAAGVKLCVDAISSLGSVPLDLAHVNLASGVSGKGLGAFPGLAMVFHNHDIAPAPDTLPRYLDLGLYARNEGVPFTQSSNLVHALHTAIGGTQWSTRFLAIAETSAWLRARLAAMGFHLVAPADHAAPGVVTVALPAGTSAVAIGLQLEEQGYLVSAHSRYLIDRNWIQICLMGESTRAQLTAVSDALMTLCGEHSFTAATPRC